MQKDPKLLIQGNRVPVGTEIAKNLARSFADSNESDRNDESIRARSFEVFDNKRLIFDIKEKENTVMELLEAIQFCHEKHSHFGMDKSLIDMTQNEAWSTISSKEDISDNKSDVTTLEFLDSLCVDVQVKKNHVSSNYVKTYIISDKILKIGASDRLLANMNRSVNSFGAGSDIYNSTQHEEQPQLGDDVYDILNTRMFNILGINSMTKRGRMSIVVNNVKKGKYSFVLYVKGTIDAMRNVLKLTKKDLISYDQMGRLYRNKGLRPIVFGMRNLSETEVMAYMESISNTQNNFQSTKRNSEKDTPSAKKKEQQNEFESLEQSLRFLGCVGETKIIRKDSQDLVKSLLSAGLDVNIASSASLNEATDIAKRLNLMTGEVHMRTFYLKDKDVAQTLENILNQLYREMKAGQMMEMDLIHKESEGAKRSRGFHKWIATNMAEEYDGRFGSFDITHLGFDITSERTLVLSGKALTKISGNLGLIQ